MADTDKPWNGFHLLSAMVGLAQEAGPTSFPLTVDDILRAKRKLEGGDKLSDVHETLDKMVTSMANGRQMGKTKAIAEAAMAIGATLVCANEMQARDLRARYPGLKTAHRHQPFHLTPHRHQPFHLTPFSRELSLWDHFAVEMTAKEALDEIMRVRKMNRELMNLNQQQGRQIIDLNEKVQDLKVHLEAAEAMNARRPKVTGTNARRKGSGKTKKAKRTKRRVRARHR